MIVVPAQAETPQLELSHGKALDVTTIRLPKDTSRLREDDGSVNRSNALAAARPQRDRKRAVR